MADSKMAAEVDEWSKMLKHLSELFAALYKIMEEDNYRVKCDLAFMWRVLLNQDESLREFQIQFSENQKAISSLQKTVKHLENGTYNGDLFVKINDYIQKKSAEERGSPCIYSEDFFSGRHGYKMCAQIYLNGDEGGRGTHLSIFLAIKKGPSDNLLDWPFQKHVTFTLLNQDGKDPRSYVLKPDQVNAPLQKPTEEMCVFLGCSSFVPHEVIEDPEKGFLRNNSIAITVKVESFR